MPTTWIRWDAGHYIQIAEEGYNYFPCAEHFGYMEDATEMCGNTGWFPGYSFLLKVACYFTGNAHDISPVISKLMFFLSVILFARIASIEKVNLRNLLILMIAIFWYGFIYYSSAFPISTLVFFILLGFYGFLRKNLWLTYVGCLLTATIYPTGFLFSGVIAISFLLKEGLYLKKLPLIVAPLILGAVGLGVVFLTFHIQVGDWSAFIQVQSKYGRGFHNPINTVALLCKGLIDGFPCQKNVIALQSLSVIVMYVVSLIYFLKKRLYNSQLHFLSFIFFTIYMCFPLFVGGELSTYRSDGTLLPAAFLFGHLSTKWLAVVTIYMLGIGIFMSHLFFIDVLI